MRIPLLDMLREGPEKRAVERANRLLEQGKIDHAIEALRSALSRKKNHPDLLLELGRILSLANRSDEAASILRTLLRTGPPDAIDRVRELAELGKLKGMEVGHVHDALAEHLLRRGNLAGCVEHLEKIDKSRLPRIVESHRKRFDSGAQSDGRPARTALLSGMYLGLAQEAVGDDAAALQTFARLLDTDATLFAKIRERLTSLASRNYRHAPLRMQVLDLYLRCGDTELAAREAMMLLEAAPEAHSELGARLASWLQEHADDDGVRLALAQVRWVGGSVDEAAELLQPLVAGGERDAELAELLAKWRVAKPDAGRVALLQAEVLGRGGRGSQAVQALSEAGADLPPEQRESALLRILERSPSEARAWRMLADLRQSQGDLDGATEAISGLRREAADRSAEGAAILRSVLERQPAHAAATRILAEIQREQDDAPTAVLLFRHAVALQPQCGLELVPVLDDLATANPTLVEARLGTAEAWLAAGEPSRALPALEEVARAGAGNAAQVAHRLSLILARHPEHAGSVRSILGQLEGKLADPAAIPYLRAEAAAAEGDVDGAVKFLGECYGLGAQRGAGPVVTLLERLLEVRPDHSSARILLAGVLADRGEALRAVSIVADAPDPDPGAVSILLERLETGLAGERNPEARAGMARLLLLAGRADEALVVAEETLREVGAAAPTILHLVRAEAWQARGDLEAAVREWQVVCGRDPALAPRAITALEEMSQVSPGDPGVALALARIRIQGGELDQGLELVAGLSIGDATMVAEACKVLQAACAAHPGDPRPLLAAARFHAGQGEAAAAGEALRRAQSAGAAPEQIETLLTELERSDPEGPDVLLVLGRARAATQPAAACSFLERSARVDRTHADDALTALAEILRARPRLPEACLSAARIHRQLGAADQAFDVLAVLLGSSPPHPDAVALLEEMRPELEGESRAGMALATAYLAQGRGDDALAELGRAVEIGAATAVLLPLLDRLVEQTGEPQALLLRARARAAGDAVDDAIADLQRVATSGRADDALQEVAGLIEGRPDHIAARRFQLRLLRESGDQAALLAAVDVALAAIGDPAMRCELLVERAEMRRRRGDEAGALADLREAEGSAEDRDAFLRGVHDSRRRRLEAGLAKAPPAEKARLLIELGRFAEAEGLLAGGAIEHDRARVLRVAMAIARGEAALGVSLMRSAPPTPLLVDAAQRCDRPGLALAALDRLLERNEDGGLRRLRKRLARAVWRDELDASRQTLVGRSAFVPRAEDQ